MCVLRSSLFCRHLNSVSLASSAHSFCRAVKADRAGVYGRFFTLILLLAMLHNMGISLFRFNGSLCRNENVASTGGAFLFLVLLLLGGFLLAKGDIPPWWIW